MNQYEHGQVLHEDDTHRWIVWKALIPKDWEQEARNLPWDEGMKFWGWECFSDSLPKDGQIIVGLRYIGSEECWGMFRYSSAGSVTELRPDGYQGASKPTSWLAFWGEIAPTLPIGHIMSVSGDVSCR